MRIREYNNFTSAHHREVRKPEAIQAVNIIDALQRQLQGLINSIGLGV